MVVGFSTWWFSQRISRIRSVKDSLNEAVQMQQNANWPGARAALDRAEYMLGPGGPAELRRDLQRARADSALAARLDEIQMERCRTVTGDGNFARTDNDYAAAFKDAGFGTDADPPNTVATRIMQSQISGRLLDALDDWSTCIRNQRCVWIIEVALQVDPKARQPGSWRAQLRNTNPSLWYDRARTRNLVDSADVKNEPPILLLALASRYTHARYNPIDFLKKIQFAHPSDFWVNFELANRLSDQGNYPEAIRFYQAAIAARPDAALAYHNLGKIFAVTDRSEEAIAELREAVRLNPGDAVFESQLGVVLWLRHRYIEAITPLQKAVDANPADSMSHLDLADCFAKTGRKADAIKQAVLAIGLAPHISRDQNELRKLLMQNNRPKMLQAAWQLALEAGPPEYEARKGLAEVSLFAGDTVAYHQECDRLLTMFRDSNDSNAAVSIAEACLLQPENEKAVGDAAAMLMRALASQADENDPRSRFIHALAEFRLGKLEPSICLLEGDFPASLGSAPHLLLAMVQFRLGKLNLARRTLVTTIGNSDWTTSRALTRDEWISHILRHEAEQLISSTR